MGASRSVVMGRGGTPRDASDDRESLASVCISPNETSSLSTISSNRLNVLLHGPPSYRAYYRPFSHHAAAAAATTFNVAD